MQRSLMPRDYLHSHPESADLIRIVAEEKSIDPALVEKDYWIMHCLYGLRQLGHTFQLKGGKSLSKGHFFGVLHSSQEWVR
jgi:predicted nucleotidyltransferase component of viral defense system